MGYIDGLRGFLALGVFLHHYMVTYYFHLTGVWQWPSSRFYAMIAQVGVALFFIITGFLFWHRILVRRGRVKWGHLYVSRIFRLTPLHWAGVILLLAAVAIAGDFTMMVPMRSLAVQAVRWFFLIGAPDINAVSGTRYICANVYWTLRYEWFFYLMLVFFAAVIRMSKKVSWAVWALAAVVFTAAKLNLNISFLGIKTVFFIFFLAGALCAAAFEQKTIRLWAQHGFAAILSLVALLSTFIFFKSAYSIKPAILMMIFFFPIAAGNRFFTFLKKPALLLLGEISYSMYLLHGFLLYIVFTFLFPGFMRHPVSLYALSAGMAGTGVLLVGVAYLSFVMIERPGIDLGKKLSRRLIK